VSRSRRPYRYNPLMTSSRRVKLDERTPAGFWFLLHPHVTHGLSRGTF